MTYKIEYISTFYYDVQSIISYLKDFPSKASRIFEKADKSIAYLEKMPEMYPIYLDMPSFRFIVIEDYLVFYKFIEDSSLVEIHRFLSGRMDILSHMKD
jgi:addiction module RelE/StbE family toxin